jgi:hypothetical protein
MAKKMLEHLANEILMEIFEYLTFTDLLHAFHRLNSRFHNLLFKYFHGHNLDFQSISKQEFDECIREYLPLIITQIKSLYLSNNNNEIPEQIEEFFSHHNISLQNFSHLKSLSISYLHSESLMFKIIDELSHLPLLTHLRFVACRFRFNQEDTQYILNRIFNQPKLTYCHLGIHFGVFRLILPTKCRISSSIQQLHLVGWTNLHELNCLFHHLSYLQHLRLCFNDTSNKTELTDVCSSIISLNILVRNSLYTMKKILQNLPNLSQLKIETQLMDLDGYQWEYLISDHLPNLKIFQLKMLITINGSVRRERQVKDLLDSFRSRFWLKERQWFVQCHWSLSYSSKTICLYTLPYAFTNYNN